MTERISYAQNGEDVRAWRALRDVPEPFYVEVGASHPFDDSLTAALAAEGWHGLLVEPEPASAEVLRQARPRDTVVAAAASAQPGVLSWSDDGVRGHGQVRSGAGGITVPAVRVGDLLEHLGPAEVHFMSVDVEGHEREALLGADLPRWAPWVLCVEATAPTSREQTHATWEDVVLAAGYTFAAFDGLNRWYVAAGHEDLRERVAEPFGVLDRILDGWVAAELQATVTELARVREELAAARRETAEAQARSQAALRGERAEHAAALRRLQDALDAVTADRDAALARERIMLESKSWRLTAPLRAARAEGTAGLRSRVGRRSLPATTAAPASSPAALRRLSAMAGRVAAARSRSRG